MKRAMWFNIILGLWLMISPFVLVSINRRSFNILWEDLILGFGIATFALCRLLSRRHQEIVFADWFITTLALLTMINPLLFNYANAVYARWNNLVGGGVVLLLALYQDWRDAGSEPLLHRSKRLSRS